MDVSLTIAVIATELVIAGVVVQFADGRCGFYSAVLLSDCFVEAEKMDEEVLLW